MGPASREALRFVTGCWPLPAAPGLACRRGIEVILDVVFNHTAEGNERGPTISFRCAQPVAGSCWSGKPDGWCNRAAQRQRTDSREGMLLCYGEGVRC